LFYVADIDSIWTTFHTLTSSTEVLRDLDLNDSKVPELKPFQVNIGMYDFLLKGGSLN
jgi:hypothetical protein